MNSWRPYEPCRENELRAIMCSHPEYLKILSWINALAFPLGWLVAANSIVRRHDQHALAATNGDWRP